MRRERGPVSATELAALLRVNRTTIARTLPDIGDELVTLGATRSTRYLLRRGIRNIGSRWPLYRVDADVRTGEWAEFFWSRVIEGVHLSSKFARFASDAQAVLVQLRRHVG